MDERRYFMWKNKKLWIAIVAILVVAIGGWQWYSSSQTKEAPTYTTGKVGKGSISSTISATGTINPVRYVDVSTNIPGKLESVLVKANQHVTAGQVIATIDSRQLQASVDNARATLNQTATDLDRYRTLVSQGAISQQTYDNALAAYEKAKASYDQVAANLTDSTITAPMDGTIIGEPLKAGQTIATGISTQMIIATIADLSDLEIYLTVDETDIGNVKEGAKVDFTVDAHPGKTFTGTVKSISLGTKGSMGTTSSSVVYYTVRVAIPAGDVSHFFPSMTARATIHGEERQNVLVVPLAAVRSDKVGEFVYVIKNGKPLRTSVKTGMTGDSTIEIISGVEEGDEIIISGDVSTTKKQQQRGPF